MRKFLLSISTVLAVQACSNSSVPLKGAAENGNAAPPPAAPADQKTLEAQNTDPERPDAPIMSNRATSSVGATEAAAAAGNLVPIESVSPPQPIAGSYLSCRMLMFAEEKSRTASVGCIFVDADKNLMTPSTLGTTITFSVQSAPLPSITYVLKPSPVDDRVIHVIVDLSGEDFSEVNQAALEVRIAANITRDDGQLGRIQNTEVQPTIPPASPGHWLAYGDHVMDKVTGLKWAQFSTAQTWLDAETSCSTLNRAGHVKWRLPTIDELRMVALHGFFDVAEVRAKNQLPSFSETTSAFWSNTRLVNEYYVYDTNEANSPAPMRLTPVFSINNSVCVLD